jgi:hypothetical protein
MTSPASNVRTVYTLASAKYVHVQLEGFPQPTTVEADSVEKHGTSLVLKKGTEVVGEIALGLVCGWWFERNLGT